MNKTAQYYIDRFKQRFYSKISGKDKKVKTGMQSVLLLLESKRVLPQKISAVELFGMHGLWHTMDYIDLVDSLDIFEIDPVYSNLSKKNLPHSKTKFHCEDSIAWLGQTKNSYDFVVADIPFSGPFYKENGLPRFVSDLFRITRNKGVLIFNSHTKYLKTDSFEDLIKESTCDGQSVKELFFVPKNSMITYSVVVLN